MYFRRDFMGQNNAKNKSESMFDEKFDNRPFFVVMRRLQNTLPDIYKLNERPISWQDKEENTFYILEGVHGIQFYENPQDEIDLLAFFELGIMTTQFQREFLQLEKKLKFEFPEVIVYASNNSNSNYVIINNIKSDLMNAYMMLVNFLQTVKQQRLLDEKRQETGYYLFQLRNGFSHISTALLTFAEGHEMLEKIFNSPPFTDEYFFLHSFDEESCEVAAFVNEYAEEVLHPCCEPIPPCDMPVVNLCVKGFEQAKEALGRISVICATYPHIREELLGFESESNYNPFRLYGFVRFADSFEHLYKIFQEELEKVHDKTP